MSDAPSDPRPLTSPADRVLPLLVALFVGSGCAALIYEIVWFQLLQLVIGSSAVSLGVLLATFMGGMCLGSLLLPRVIGPARHPLRVYAALELGIGVIGLAVIAGLPYLDQLYAAIAARGLAGIAIRGAIAGLCLLPPTLLMGATLPAIARWVQATPRGIAWLGFFYGGNIAGAVFGCLLAGFFLLRVYDMLIATYLAVAINFAVAIAALGIAAIAPYRAITAAGSPRPAPAAVRPAWGVYLAIGLSGLGALGAEVIWTRLLSLLLGGTVYTFSIILAVFLIGLGLGSSTGSLLARETRQPRLALGICQLLLAAAVGWAAWMLARSLPYWPIEPSLARSAWHTFQLDLLRCLWVVLPAACLWGASFPLALAAANPKPGHPLYVRTTVDPGRLVGGVYAANTIGAIAGALLFSTLLVGWFPAQYTQHAQQLIIGVAVVSALAALVPLLWTNEDGEQAAAPSPAAAAARTLALAAGVLIGGLIAARVPPTPGELIAYGRSVPTRGNWATILYQGEGLNSSVAVTVTDGEVRNFHVSGKVEASSEPQDMRLQRMLGHIPALLHPRPRSVLVVGCGAGVTAGSFLVHPEVERVVICEIEPLIPRVVAEYFSLENYDVVNDKRVEIVFDDARHFILTTREKFDVITSDPINPWVKGAATLYTREYFELCRRRLKPGGVITQWVPLYESTTEAVKSELATFFDVFPHGTVWSNDIEGRGYDIVLLGHEQPLTIDVEQLAARLAGPQHLRVAYSLEEVGFESALDLLATYAGSAGDLAPWLAKAEINRDRNLRLQYLAGMAANTYSEAAIFYEMLKYRQFPDQLFIASDGNRQELKRRLGL